MAFLECSKCKRQTPEIHPKPRGLCVHCRVGRLEEAVGVLRDVALEYRKLQLDEFGYVESEALARAERLLKDIEGELHD